MVQFHLCGGPSFKFTGPQTKFLWVAPPSLGPNETDISQKNSVGPSKGLEQLSQLSSFLATDLGGTNIPRRGKRQNPTKRSASLKWIERRWEPVWASSPFTIQLSLSIKHADIHLGFTEATSRTVFHSSWASKLVISGKELATFVQEKTNKQKKILRQFIFIWLKAVMKCRILSLVLNKYLIALIKEEIKWRN